MDFRVNTVKSPIWAAAVAADTFPRSHSCGRAKALKGAANSALSAFTWWARTSEFSPALYLPWGFRSTGRQKSYGYYRLRRKSRYEMRATPP